MTEKNLSNNDLYEKLEKLLNAKVKEIKNDIKTINTSVANLESKYNKLENRIINLDRKGRKNNILIFGFQEVSQDSLLNVVVTKLNQLLGIDLGAGDVNNIYTIGNKNTIVIEFISYIRKQTIFKSIKKLKGTGISITNDLCPEDQHTRKILYENLKDARSKQLPAYIKRNKLYVNNEPYTVAQLLREESVENDDDYQTYGDLEAKSNSAPPTPQATHFERILSPTPDTEVFDTHRKPTVTKEIGKIRNTSAVSNTDIPGSRATRSNRKGSQSQFTGPNFSKQ